jgi:hypothetical protein
MHPETRHVFVYGWLLFPTIVQALTARNFQRLPARLDGFRRYAVKQTGSSLAVSPVGAAVVTAVDATPPNPAATLPIMPIPALMADAKASTHGMLLLDVDANSLAMLDVFEEVDSGLYQRHAVRVFADNQWFNADCYIAGESLLPYLAGEWSPDALTPEQFDYMLNTVIPDLLSAFPLQA